MRKLFNLEYALVIIGLIILPLQTSACQLTIDTTAKIQTRLLTCESLRPLMCQQNSSPVCGVFARNKPAQTFRNACLACKNPEVKGYERGPCKEDLRR